MREKKETREKASRSILENNKFVFALSLLIALVCWCAISVVNTQETTRTITGVKVQFTQTEELREKFGLAVFDQTDYFIDVTLKGYSYLLRDLTSDNIDLTASCASVAAAGTYDLPVSSALSGNVNANVHITKLSANTVKVYFDKEVEKTFTLVEDVEEKAGYSLAEGYERENPILSPETVTISGASRDISRIVTVKAHVELDKVLNSTERLEAELILESDTGALDAGDFNIRLDTPVYITIPVTHTGTYDAAVDFSNMPQYYKTNGFDYTVAPATVDVTSSTSIDANQIQSHQISVGTVDFSDIEPGVVNTFTLRFDAGSGENEYTVTIDMTDMESLTVDVPVDASNITLPSNVKINSAEIAAVTLACPEDVQAELDSTAVYAVPVLDGLSAYPAGRYTVPAKIVFRTLTNCWAYGRYTIDITVS